MTEQRCLYPSVLSENKEENIKQKIYTLREPEHSPNFPVNIGKTVREDTYLCMSEAKQDSVNVTCKYFYLRLWLQTAERIWCKVYVLGWALDRSWKYTQWIRAWDAHLAERKLPHAAAALPGVALGSLFTPLTVPTPLSIATGDWGPRDGRLGPSLGNPIPSHEALGLGQRTQLEDLGGYGWGHHADDASV